MYDNYNYPLGADNEDAPWNEKPTPEIDFEVLVSQTLSKSTIVTTSDYIYTENVEYDDEGSRFLERDQDTENTNWERAYNESGLHTPLELIELFGEFLKEHLKTIPDDKVSEYKRRRCMDLIIECEDWTSDDLEIVEE